MGDLVEYRIVNLQKNPYIRQPIVDLLSQAHLTLDETVTVFVVAEINDKLVACAGIDRNVVKCVVIDMNYRGEQLSLALINQVISYANDQGFFHLFLYTKPENTAFFKGCGFYQLVNVPNLVVFMENTPLGIKRYCQTLLAATPIRSTNAKVGGIVMNANPFTKGHLYLAEYAAKYMDIVHIFIVQEEASLFSFAERFELVKQGVAHLTNVIVHSSSYYLVSKATFPTYFLSNPEQISQAYMAVDLLIFRNYIAPTLQINYRFVGTEPNSIVTHAYNESMQYWLTDKAISHFPAVNVVEIPRTELNGVVISASKVRQLLITKDYDAIKNLVPDTTWRFLENKFKQVGQSK